MWTLSYSHSSVYRRMTILLLKPENKRTRRLSVESWSESLSDRFQIKSVPGEVGDYGRTVDDPDPDSGPNVLDHHRRTNQLPHVNVDERLGHRDPSVRTLKGREMSLLRDRVSHLPGSHPRHVPRTTRRTPSSLGVFPRENPESPTERSTTSWRTDYTGESPPP